MASGDSRGSVAGLALAVRGANVGQPGRTWAIFRRTRCGFAAGSLPCSASAHRRGVRRLGNSRKLINGMTVPKNGVPPRVTAQAVTSNVFFFRKLFVPKKLSKPLIRADHWLVRRSRSGFRAGGGRPEAGIFRLRSVLLDRGISAVSPYPAHAACRQAGRGGHGIASPPPVPPPSATGQGWLSSCRRSVFR